MEFVEDQLQIVVILQFYFPWLTHKEDLVPICWWSLMNGYYILTLNSLFYIVLFYLFITMTNLSISQL